MSKKLSKHKHLFKRGKIWYVRYKFEGLTVVQSTKQTKLEAAKDVASTIIKAATSDHPAIVRALKEARRPAETPACSTFEDLHAAYRSYYELHGIGSGPEQWNSLVRVLWPTVGQVDVSPLSLDLLRRETVRTYQTDVVSRAQSDEAKVRARRTANSTMNKARAVFTTRALEHYEHKLVLPDLTGFLKVPAVLADTVQYVRRPVELVERTIRLGRELRETDRDLYQCFLCSYDLGLRANESANLRWAWLGKDAEGWAVQVAITPDWEGPKGSQGTVSISEEVAKQLMEHRQPGNDYVLPPDTYTGRYNLVTRKFASWMRSIGWDPDVYQGAAHELRKLMGSRWYTVQGPAVASANLRHSSVATTCKYYAVLDRRPAPLTMDQANGHESAPPGDIPRSALPMDGVDSPPA